MVDWTKVDYAIGFSTFGFCMHPVTVYWIEVIRYYMGF